jgi:thiamine biosynthesis lipoprotein ApbE
MKLESAISEFNLSDQSGTVTVADRVGKVTRARDMYTAATFGHFDCYDLSNS